jgi:Reverse transcriptase (RNA-dependent DNA polymerase)
VSRESVCIGLLIAALNDLDVLAANIQGAYLNAPCGEKVYTICGPEFGKDEGRIGVITKALYGLKTSGFQWHVHLAETLHDMKFKMCAADNDVWYRAAVKDNSTEYYEYVLVYTDDILAISHAPMQNTTVLPSSYRPELDGTDYCNEELHQYYQQANRRTTMDGHIRENQHLHQSFNACRIFSRTTDGTFQSNDPYFCILRTSPSLLLGVG